MVTLVTKQIPNTKERVDKKRVDDDGSIIYFKKDMRCEDAN